MTRARGKWRVLDLEGGCEEGGVVVSSTTAT